MKTLGGSSPPAASQPLTPAAIPVPLPVYHPAPQPAPVAASAQPLPVVGVPTIALLQSSSLPALVQAELERMIVCGELQPGAKLTEMALAARLGVSRGPLREAFRMLEEAGLVRTEKNRGVFVRDVPLDEAVEIFDLRAAMDELVGRQLALRITPAQLKEVRAMVEAMERAVKAADLRGYHLLNLQFHDRLVDMAGNRKLTAIYRKLIKELSLFRRMNLAHLAEDGLLPLSAGEHRAIVKAIASGDTQAAGQAMFDHVMQSKERMLSQHPAAVQVGRA
jgi:phosphonate utilization transcriptional regulator